MLDILYQQGPVWGLNKPPGLATQAPEGIDSLEAQLRAHLKQLEQKTGNIYLGVPHRLDRAASGAIVFARHVRAARRISQQFERRTVRKIYWACVEGIVSPAEGTWRDWLLKVYGHPRAEVVNADHPQGREAILHYRTLGQTAHGSWLEIELQTGRTHQVRIQAASRGHPILGDAFYGGNSTFGVQFEDERLRAIALHARQLELTHPMTKQPLAITAPVHAAWKELGLNLPDCV